ncbi:MAG: Uncharacterised protein [Cyanobium sp. ARS6]|nr:MAG: Uncharacterised protein [Cyanobium sp. ARS6]
MIHALVIGQHRDDLVINLTTIIKGHDADDACFNDRTWNQRLSDIHDLDVEWIAIFIPGPGNAAVGEGIGQRGITNPIELQVTGLGDQLVLVDRVRVELNDRVQTQLGFISEGRQHMQQVGHAAAWSLVEVGHGRRHSKR